MAGGLITVPSFVAPGGAGVPGGELPEMESNSVGWWR